MFEMSFNIQIIRGETAEPLTFPQSNCDPCSPNSWFYVVSVEQQQAFLDTAVWVPGVPWVLFLRPQARVCLRSWSEVVVAKPAAGDPWLCWPFFFFALFLHHKSLPWKHPALLQTHAFSHRGTGWEAVPGPVQIHPPPVGNERLKPHGSVATSHPSHPCGQRQQVKITNGAQLPGCFASLWGEHVYPCPLLLCYFLHHFKHH